MIIRVLHEPHLGHASLLLLGWIVLISNYHSFLDSAAIARWSFMMVALSNAFITLVTVSQLSNLARQNLQFHWHTSNNMRNHIALMLHVECPHWPTELHICCLYVQVPVLKHKVFHILSRPYLSHFKLGGTYSASWLDCHMSPQSYLPILHSLGNFHNSFPLRNLYSQPIPVHVLDGTLLTLPIMLHSFLI